jgi:hypothetical protein
LVFPLGDVAPYPKGSGKINVFRAISFVRDVFEDGSIDVKSYYHNDDMNRDLLR